MKSAVETLNPTRVKLSVEVAFEEFEPSMQAAYRRIGGEINVPGFRKGKVPRAIIDQRVGRANVLAEAINEALPNFYVKALEENDITPLSSPELDVPEVEYGEPVTFVAELDVAPKIELPEFHGLQAEVPDLDVADNAADEAVEQLRERFATVLPVDRAAQDGDMLVLDLTATHDGEPIDDAVANDISYRIGSGTMLDGLDEAVTGLSAGETATFSSQLVGGDYAGQEVEVTVTVTAVKEQELPELDDEFAQTASEFDTFEELRAAALDEVTRAARLDQAMAARDAVLEKLLSLVDAPLPQGAIDDEKRNRNAQLDQQLAYLGMNRAAYLEQEGKTEEEHDADLEKQVRNALLAQFVLNEIAKVEQIGVEQGELTSQLLRRAEQAGVPPEEYVKHAVEHNHLPEVVDEVRRAKALAHVVETAEVSDASGNKVELATLLPDGSYADPEDIEESGVEAHSDAGGDAATDVVIAGDYATFDDPS